MNRKKLISVGLTAAMLTGLLAGCGDSSQNSSQNGSGSEPVVLQWWGSFPENMGPNQVCEAFNKIDPNLQVEYTRFVNDDAGNTKLDVSLMSDSSIDVFLSLNDVLLNKRIDSGYAEPLDELFDKVGFNIKDDYDDAIEQRQKDGHYYSLPAKKMTSTILYNKDMFDEAGVAYPDADWTYDEFLDAATKLTHGEGNNKVYGYFFPGYDAGQPATSMLVSKLGADWMYTEDGTKAAIDTDDVKDVTLLYTLYKSKIKTYRIDKKSVCFSIGAFLGIISSFLGIGGGPINLVVLFFFFSMPTKIAAENSLYIIFFSQGANLISTIISGNVPEFKPEVLILMIVGGIAGGICGRKINEGIDEKIVDMLFIGLMIMIMLINVYNIYKYI